MRDVLTEGSEYLHLLCRSTPHCGAFHHRVRLSGSSSERSTPTKFELFEEVSFAPQKSGLNLENTSHRHLSSCEEVVVPHKADDPHRGSHLYKWCETKVTQTSSASFSGAEQGSPDRGQKMPHSGLCFGQFGLMAKEPGIISAAQISATSLAIKRKLQRNGKL